MSVHQVWNISWRRVPGFYHFNFMDMSFNLKQCRGSVCKEKKVTPLQNHKVRVYKGSMRGGLKLDRKLKHKNKPIIGIVDDIEEDDSINTDALKEEHLQEPQHFGIHLSKLESLDNERVQDKEREIVDIF